MSTYSLQLKVDGTHEVVKADQALEALDRSAQSAIKATAQLKSRPIDTSASRTALVGLDKTLGDVAKEAARLSSTRVHLQVAAPGLANLNRDLTQLSAASKQAGAAAAGAANNIRSIGSSAAGASGGLNGLLAGVAQLGVGLAAAGAARSVFVKAAEVETQTKAIAQLAGGAEAAKRIIGELQQLGAATPFTSTELVESAKKLAAFGVPAAALVDVTSRLGDVAGSTGARLGDIATIYGQIQAKGKLQTEELLQLQERGIDIQSTLKQQYGVTGAEFTKLLESGAISAEAVNQAFEKLTSTGGRYFGGASAQATTVAGRFSTLQDNIDSLARTIGQTLEPVTKAVLEGAIALAEAFGRLPAELQTAIAVTAGLAAGAVALGGVIGAVGLALPAITAGFAAASAAALPFLAAAAPVALIAGGLVLLGKAAYDLIPPFQEFVDRFPSRFAEFFRLVVNDGTFAFRELQKLAADWSAAIGGAVTQVQSFFQQLTGEIGRLWNNVTSTLMAPAWVQTVVGFAQRVGRTFSSLFAAIPKQVTDAVTAAVRALFPLGAAIDYIFQRARDASANAIGGQVSSSTTLNDGVGATPGMSQVPSTDGTVLGVTPPAQQPKVGDQVGGDSASSATKAAAKDKPAGSGIPTIRQALQVVESTGYNVMFGGGRFSSYADHPRKLVSAGGYTSDAAGKYQFLSTTWDPIAKALGLKDFSPKNQDLAAEYYARQRTSNRVGLDSPATDANMSALAPIWAGFPMIGRPGGRYDQAKLSFAEIRRQAANKPGGSTGGTGAEDDLMRQQQQADEERQRLKEKNEADLATSERRKTLAQLTLNILRETNPWMKLKLEYARDEYQIAEELADQNRGVTDATAIANNQKASAAKTEERRITLARALKELTKAQVGELYSQVGLATDFADEIGRAAENMRGAFSASEAMDAGLVRFERLSTEAKRSPRYEATMAAAPPEARAYVARREAQLAAAKKATPANNLVGFTRASGDLLAPAPTGPAADAAAELQKLTSPTQLLETNIRGLADGFGTLFRDIASGSASAGQAFSNFAKSIGDSLLDQASRIVSSKIASMLLGALLPTAAPAGGLFSGGGAGFASVFGGGGGGYARGFSIEGLLPGRARGGPVFGDRPYVVGEEGPELMVPGSAGTVIPNLRTGVAGPGYDDETGEVIGAAAEGGIDPVTGERLATGSAAAIAAARRGLNSSLARGAGATGSAADPLAAARQSLNSSIERGAAASSAAAALQREAMAVQQAGKPLEVQALRVGEIDVVSVAQAAELANRARQEAEARVFSRLRNQTSIPGVR